MRRTLIRALVIVSGGIAVALAANAVRTDVDSEGHARRLPLIAPAPATLNEADLIRLPEAELLWRGGEVFFLDARSPADFAAGHIALAHNLPAEEFTQYYPPVSAMLTKDAAVVVYCDGLQCDLSRQLAARLRNYGYTNVRVLQNGWTVWRDAGLPVEPRKP